MKGDRNHSAIFFPAVQKLSQAIIFCLAFIPLAGLTSPLVTATYQNAGGSELSVKIEVGSPPPASLILIQKLPPGTNILRSQPPAQKINPEKGEAKWLFRKLKPGSMTVSFSLDRQVTAAEVSGQIRFKLSGGEAMESLPVSKP